MFGLCVQTVVHAHAAVADMAMIAAGTASAWAGWNWLKSREGGGDRGKVMGWWLAFWGLLAVGFLAKGPIAWVPIGMTGWTAARMERGKRPGALEWALGVVVMLAVAGVWGIPAMMQTHGEFAVVGLGKHVVLRSVSPLEGHGAKTWQSYLMTFPLYGVTIWPSFFPWSLWLPAAALELWRRRKQWRLEETYLVTGIVLVFGIFTLSRTGVPLPGAAAGGVVGEGSGKSVPVGGGGNGGAGPGAAAGDIPAGEPVFCLATAI
jgi:4-amino-4-deoxy-L-arabinose transferase-like glycosyltransferase